MCLLDPAYPTRVSRSKLTLAYDILKFTPDIMNLQGHNVQVTNPSLNLFLHQLSN